MELATVEAEARGRAILVTLSGEVDLSNADPIAAAIGSHVDGRVRLVVLDLSEATYLDSAGIRVLFHLAGRLRTRRRELVLVVPPRARLRSVLDLSGVFEVIRSYPEVEAALADAG